MSGHTVDEVLPEITDTTDDLRTDGGADVDGSEREGCHTVKCHSAATTTLRVESDYESLTGETKTTVLRMSYCDEHAEMWLKLDGATGRRYEVIDERAPGDQPEP